MGGFIREKKIHCGDEYQVVEIYPYSDERERGARVSGRVRVAETCPAQRRVNSRRAQMYLEQLIFANFIKGDFYITLSYSDKYLPNDDYDADREFGAFMRRVKYREKKRGLEPGRYINVVESTDVTGKPVRYHHHLLLSTGLSEAEVRACWRHRGDAIGWMDVTVIEPEDGDGIIRLADYLTKSADLADIAALAEVVGRDGDADTGNTPAGRAGEQTPVSSADTPFQKGAKRGRRPNRKRWSASRNLVRPYATRNDSRYSVRQFERIAAAAPDADFWEAQYPGFRLLAPPNGYAARQNPETGEWGVRLRMRRIDNNVRARTGNAALAAGRSLYTSRA
jgi:hypothetical protein